MNSLSTVFLVIVGLPLIYLYLLVSAAVRIRSIQPSQRPHHRFAIAIPAHNEETIIGRTVTTLRQLDYPPHLFDIHVAADHCTDHTVRVARAAGAIVHERREGSRGKGVTLRWLFQRVLNPGPNVLSLQPYDAVVVFDADTQVAPDFLRLMDTRLSEGCQVIQGQHRISNPDDGWFPALTWAMFMVDNRFQNLGRSNLGWSAKNMGDSICFRAEILRRLGWGDGLTEDYAFRQRLLLEGIRIHYEPAAVGYGEAPTTWEVARAQRARWLRGTHDASRCYARQLLREGLGRRDLALLDGALQAYLPSYSSLTLITLAAFIVQLTLRIWDSGLGVAHLLPALWSLVIGALVIYPFLGLALEGAPFKAYLAILSGPVFIFWRTWLALTSRLGRHRVEWVRTPRKVQ